MSSGGKTIRALLKGANDAAPQRTIISDLSRPESLMRIDHGNFADNDQWAHLPDEGGQLPWKKGKVPRNATRVMNKFSKLFHEFQHSKDDDVFNRAYNKLDSMSKKHFGQPFDDVQLDLSMALHREEL